VSTPTPFKYGWKTLAQPYNYSYLAPLVCALGKGLGARKVLDVGAGNGYALPTWLKQGWEVCAMEPDVEGYTIAKTVEEVDVRQLGVGEELPAQWRNAFDTVICMEVVEHLFDPHQLANTTRDALQDDGYAIISTPYHGYLKNLALSLVDKWDFHHHPLRVGGHIKFWSKATLRTLFEKEGFKAVSFHGAGRLPYLWNSMVWVFQKG
jgi:2-polyprenyl-3-methyl-5-hydroxy-6-metoxy-1,4-benzoquinol methylase